METLNDPLFYACSTFSWVCLNVINEDILFSDLGEDEPMIQYLNRSCPTGSFFHLCCFNLDEDNLPDEWVCGDTCRKTIEDTIYCVCQSVKEETMIECSNDQCEHQWFHVSCKGIKDLPDSGNNIMYLFINCNLTELYQWKEEKKINYLKSYPNCYIIVR